jgi:ABC transporter DrrB family efflux protein
MTMTATSPTELKAMRRLPLGSAIADTITIAKRNLITLTRTPQLVVFSTIQPIMFVLLFRYVFGGSISIPGMPYVDYLIPGIIVQTALFAGAAASIGMAVDSVSGIFDRFRSLPMARSAVLGGRTLADTVRALFVILLMVFVGTLVGFRFHNGFIGGLAGIALCLLFAFSFLWFFAFVGLSMRDPETAQVASFLPIFPFVFASSIFTVISNMPPWLQAFARNQPITFVANAVRGLTQGAHFTCSQQLNKIMENHSINVRVPGRNEFIGCDSIPKSLLPHVESTASYTIKAVLWMIVIVAIFAPLAVRRYRKG